MLPYENLESTYSWHYLPMMTERDTFGDCRIMSVAENQI